MESASREESPVIYWLFIKEEAFFLKILLPQSADGRSFENLTVHGRAKFSCSSVYVNDHDRYQRCDTIVRDNTA
ncbi:hypothetical protein EVAR_97850_1 [Eumeta japonica]|uniref:Uncharacterized protein n=1 Tax=Eumeta variegata TaxID=151549 RepID=A0A4C1WY94_EUMVA|nr:hypothetical protein EVAR_97850_1 [Eumeta japonica]